MKIQVLAGLMVALSAIPAATADTTPSTADNRGASCLRPRDIDGFIDAHRDHVVLTNGGRHFKATFVNDCVGIEYAFGLAAEAHTACLSSGDALNFRDNTGLPQHCLIKTLDYIPEAKAP